jgi:hypothetical protein
MRSATLLPRPAFLAIAMIFGLTCNCFGNAVIGDFEDSTLDGWGTDGGAAMVPPMLSQSSAFGVTSGSSSLLSQSPHGSFWGPSTGNLAAEGFTSALEQATAIQWDETMIGTEIGGGAPFSGFFQSNEMYIQIFANPQPGTSLPLGVNAFIQRNWMQAGLVDTSGNMATWSGIDGTRTLSYDLTKFTFKDPSDGVTKTAGAFLAAHPDVTFDIKLGPTQQDGLGATDSGGDGTTHAYFDNVQLITPTPEPASLALLGSGAVILLIRRRRPV